MDFSERELDRWCVAYSDGPLDEYQHYRKASVKEALNVGFGAGSQTIVKKIARALQTPVPMLRPRQSIVADLRKIVHLLLHDERLDNNDERRAVRRRQFVKRLGMHADGDTIRHKANHLRRSLKRHDDETLYRIANAAGVRVYVSDDELCTYLARHHHAGAAAAAAGRRR